MAEIVRPGNQIALAGPRVAFNVGAKETRRADRSNHGRRRADRRRRQLHRRNASDSFAISSRLIALPQHAGVSAARKAGLDLTPVCNNRNADHLVAARLKTWFFDRSCLKRRS